MKAGIIAAGKGERLVQGGISIPKPLLPILGEPMIGRAIRAAATLDVTSVACIVNELNPEVVDYLKQETWPIPLDIVVKTTPSSMESLFCLAPLLKEEPFVLLTVDAIFSNDTLKDFVRKAHMIDRADGALAVTGFVDDEKPLWVKLDGHDKIVAMGNSARDGGYVTSGFYYFSPEIFSTIDDARRNNLNALRQFLGLLVKRGFSIYGIPVPKTLGVDHPKDIKQAEAFLRKIEG